MAWHWSSASGIEELGYRCHGIGGRRRSKCQQAPRHLTRIYELSQLFTNNDVDWTDEGQVAMLTMHSCTLLQLRTDVFMKGKHSYWVKLGQLCTKKGSHETGHADRIDIIGAVGLGATVEVDKVEYLFFTSVVLCLDSCGWNFITRWHWSHQRAAVVHTDCEWMTVQCLLALTQR